LCKRLSHFSEFVKASEDTRNRAPGWAEDEEAAQVFVITCRFLPLVFDLPTKGPKRMGQQHDIQEKEK